MDGAKAGGAGRLRRVAADRECFAHDERRAPRMLRDRARGIGARHHHRAPRAFRQLEVEELDAKERRQHDVVAARAQRCGGARAVGLGAGHQQPHGVTRWLAILTSSLPGLTPQVGFTRLAAVKLTELGQARVPMQSICFRKNPLAKKMDARVTSAFTRVFDALLPAHDEMEKSKSIAFTPRQRTRRRRAA